MPVEVTLTPGDYAVFSRVPFEWSDETWVAVEISKALDIKSGVAMRRVSRFVAVGLLERRPGGAGAARTEIRRIGKR